MHTSNRLSICNRIFFTFSIAILHIFDIIICVLELEVMGNIPELLRRCRADQYNSNC